MPPPPSSHRRSTAWAVAVSTLLHLAAWATAGALPQRQRAAEPRPPIDALEITVLDPAVLEALSPAVTDDQSPQTADAQASDPPTEVAPAVPEQPPAQTKVPTPGQPPTPSPAAPTAEPTAEPSPLPETAPPVAPAAPAAPAAPSAEPGAGSLLTMRGTGPAYRGPVPRPADVMPKIPPRPAARPVGPELPPTPARTKDREPRSLAEAGFKPHRDGTYRYRDKTDAFKAVLHPNGRVEFKLKVSQLYRLGLSDAAREASGEELFARAKKELLAQTFQLRLNMAVGWAESQMQTQLKALNRQLLETWKRPELSAPRRRQELFTLWDDCEESLELDSKGVEASIDSRLDQARASAGKKARAKIVEFIGRHLPADSGDAYTDAELRSLNSKRQSRQRFEPYGRHKDG